MSAIKNRYGGEKAVVRRASVKKFGAVVTMPSTINLILHSFEDSKDGSVYQFSALNGDGQLAIDGGL